MEPKPNAQKTISKALAQINLDKYLDEIMFLQTTPWMGEVGRRLEPKPNAQKIISKVLTQTNLDKYLDEIMFLQNAQKIISKVLKLVKTSVGKTQL